VLAFGRTLVAAAIPIGIDTQNFEKFATSREATLHLNRMKKVLGDRLQVIGVDRLDYTKGLPQRFEAFERLLADYPENRGRTSFVQVAPPSREDVAEYVDIREQLEQMAGNINGQYSDYDWTPLRYLNRGFSRQALAGMYRASRVGLVTPLRDGMNLVAKEYIAAQSEDDPGVLVLSRFAGAAKQADGALIVNPYDIYAVAEALQTALNMPFDERLERRNRMMDRMRREDVAAWRNDFIGRLEAVATATRSGG
ncbi:MAG TPA: trehalose-6-phosphate synthase, partial [Alphaproteobacteria bacterium]|nr:trehalose-6-phosphate synthase [Alphaproteobacteria bacterium]